MVPMRDRKVVEATHEPTTPGLSQEGNSASVPDIGSPPPEGLGVGSWLRFASKFWRFSLPMNRPLTPSLSPSEGERVPEGRVRGWFMVSTHAEKRRRATHEPTHP